MTSVKLAAILFILVLIAQPLLFQLNRWIGCKYNEIKVNQKKRI